ncbi:50S ribosomal protein L22 [candidate division KSB1 bacterium RBG_16_48_16]|nr:MAG: 50S ribosomal protein L22 [candidate division KSB1 bacterium RBG_16_48_16]
MEARAITKWVRTSPIKMRRVAKLVRGKQVNEALNILHFNNTSASEPLEKTVRSAVANLMNSDDASKISPEDLYIKELRIDGGVTFKRFRAGSMGRASRIRRRTSHISVVVAETEE